MIDPAKFPVHVTTLVHLGVLWHACFDPVFVVRVGSFLLSEFWDLLWLGKFKILVKIFLNDSCNNYQNLTYSMKHFILGVEL
jgi:hypothetical protein